MSSNILDTLTSDHSLVDLKIIFASVPRSSDDHSAQETITYPNIKDCILRCVNNSVQDCLV